MAVKKTFRLTDEAADRLADMAEKEGRTATQVVCDAILAYGSEPYGCHTQSHTGAIREPYADGSSDGALDGLRSAVDALTVQLATKDEQIAGLMAALSDAQSTAKAAQALHASDRMALESAEQKRSRWQRIVDAWKG